MRFAVDSGGTFTDLVVEDEDLRLRVYKAATTPENPINGILAAIDAAAGDLGVDRQELLGRGEMFIHGTTRAINAILTEATARTAFLTTQGHPDILLFREGGRTGTFDWTRPYPEPYVPRRLTYEIPERIGAAGEIVLPLDEPSVLEIVETLRGEQVEAVAVCLLWSIANPIHEQRVGELLEDHLPGVPYTLSHELNPILREYRRASSTAIDASLKPVMSDYLSGLDSALRAAGFGGRLLMVTSGGGMLDAADVAAAPIHSLGSGPAMAPIAGRAFAESVDPDAAVVVADSGGTSFDVSLVRRGMIPKTAETWLGPEFFGHMTGFPAIDVKSIGAGGGSIAWVDDGGLLHVGPQSAGASPGPACYDRGGSEPTVTDASVVLGYLDPDYFLGGKMRLSVERATAVLTELGEQLSLDAYAAAAAVLELATEHMARAIEEITVNQGIDPREAVLVAGGGAAGLNVVAIARRLRTPKVLIPDVGPVLSAAGALMSDLTTEFAAASPTRSDDFDFDAVNDLLAELVRRSVEFADEPGRTAVSTTIETFAEARYPQQNWELEVPLEADFFDGPSDVERLRKAFDARHEEIFGISDAGSPIELIGWRARVACRLRDLQPQHLSHQSAKPLAGTRRAYFSGPGPVDATVVRFEDVPVGERITGPAIVESPVTTVVVDPGASVERHSSGSLMLVPGAAAGVNDRSGDSLDSVGLAVLTNRFEGIVRAMMNTLFRTGRSCVINTSRDFSCCIVTSDDELLVSAESLPVHVMRGPDLMSAVMKELQPGFRLGDAFLNNSPYHGNSHAADHTILVPVIDEQGTHRFTAVAKAHQADCGNALPTTYAASARDVYEEGALIFPCVKVQQDYEHIEDFIRMCEARIRVPEQWWGDYLALLGAARIGERLVLELGREVGWDRLQAYTSQWFDYSERRMVEAIRLLPSAEFTAKTVHDPFAAAPDGIPVQARVRVDSDEAIIGVDLRENLDCQPCGLNLTQSTAETAAMMGIFNSIPQTPPVNAGSYRRLRIELRENCVVGVPRHPASCSLATSNVADRLVNAVQRGMAELADGVGMAEMGLPTPPSCGVISGLDPRTGRAFVNQIILAALTGGAGSAHADGWLTTGLPACSGMLLRDSIEVDELRYPIRVLAQHIIPDSEGAGMFRGSPGAYAEYEAVDCSVSVAYHSDSSINPPLGARGGLPGAKAAQFKRLRSGELIAIDPFGLVVLEPGETVVSSSCGGGGYGAPVERDVMRVAHDVREGWISAQRAAEVYGVVIRADGDIDRNETARQRARSKSVAAAVAR